MSMAPAGDRAYATENVPVALPTPKMKKRLRNHAGGRSGSMPEETAFSKSSNYLHVCAYTYTYVCSGNLPSHLAHL